MDNEPLNTENKGPRRVTIAIPRNVWIWLRKRANRNLRTPTNEILATILEEYRRDEARQLEAQSTKSLKEANDQLQQQVAELQATNRALLALEDTSKLAPHGTGEPVEAGPHATLSGYKGVYRYGLKWQAKTMLNGQYEKIGVFNTPREAALAYDEFCRSIGAKNRTLNFPTEEEKRGGISEDTWKKIMGGPAGNPKENNGYKFTTPDGGRHEDLRDLREDAEVDLTGPVPVITFPNPSTKKEN